MYYSILLNAEEAEIDEFNLFFITESRDFIIKISYFYYHTSFDKYNERCLSRTNSDKLKFRNS